jgi:hypothetical protein
MRGIFLLALGATLVPILYFHGPDLLHFIEKKEPLALATAEVPEKLEATSTATSIGSEMAKQSGTTDADAIRATMIESKTQVQKAPVEPSAAKQSKAKPRQKKPTRRLKRKNHRAETLPAAPNLLPVSTEKGRKATLVASASGKVSLFQQPSLSDPMQGRWIDSLSGQKASVSMGKQSMDRDCQKTTVGCDQHLAPKEARLVGLVMESDRVIKTPTAALEGRLVRGHYQRDTPALYVK